MKYYGFLIGGFTLGLFCKNFFSSVEQYFYLKNTQVVKPPKHIGIIMDGNGRWAQKRNEKRTFGHKNSVSSVEASINTCMKYGVKFLTLYAFSTENWGRPQEEIDEIFSLINEYYLKEKNKVITNGIKVNILGDMSRLPEDLQKNLNSLIDETKENDKLVLNVCLNYSGRWDIVNACNTLLKDKNIEKISYDDFAQALSTAGMPDPDIIIRTGGEKRISSFLSWQCAYSELFFLDKFWPDFNSKDLRKILLDYQKRNRRFGKLN